MARLTDEQALSIAKHIYTEVYGSIDDECFKDDKVGEIEDWLKDGDPADDLSELVVEWREYDAAEIAERIA